MEMIMKRYKEIEEKVRNGEIDSSQLDEMMKTGSINGVISIFQKQAHKKSEFEETEQYLQALESEVKKEISEFDLKAGDPQQASKPDAK